MRVLIFGATGPAGALTVDAALRAGHDVTVYVRNPAKVSRTAEIATIKGDLTDKGALAAAIAEQDAVISLLGPSGRSKGTPISDGLRNIVEAMERHGVKRFVATATTSASDPQDRFRFPFWLASRMIKLLMGDVYADVVAEADLIRRSSLDWTIVRLPWLTSRPNDTPAVAGYVGDPAIKLFFLSRERLAEFLIAQLADRRWIRKAPAVSNG